MTSEANYVFISYKAEDQKRVKLLVEALEAEGFNVWWDQYIGGGTNWRKEIETHLNAAKVVIVAWSKRSVGPEGEFVRDEAAQARADGHYLPITIDKVRPPLGFREVQAIGLSNWNGNRADSRFKLLVGNVRCRLEGREIKHIPIAPKAPVISRRTAIAGGVGATTLAVAVGAIFLRPSSVGSKRIAVLPFANLSGDPSQDYFSDGLSDELRAALSRAGLEVIGRNSSEAVADEDIATIVRKLDVGHVLTGSVRQSPTTLRISAQLVEGKSGVERWAQSYDRAPGDSIRIQSDIAEQVASALSVAMGTIKKAVELGGTNDPVAQGYTFQSYGIFRKQGSTKASLRAIMNLFQNALERDPNFGRAWVGLAQAKAIFAGLYAATPSETASMLDAAERDTRRALSIAPELANAYSVLGRIAATRNDLPAALHHCREALVRSPNGLAVLVDVTNYLYAIGTLNEAMNAAQRLVLLDPFSPTAQHQLAQVLDAAGRLDEAIAAIGKGVELAPQNVNLAFLQALLAIEKGDLSGAINVSLRLPEGDYRKAVVRGLVAARRGQKPEMEMQIGALRKDYGELASYQYAQIYAQAGEIQLAFAALALAEKVKDPGLASTMRDPLLKPLRKDARMLALLKRLRFPIIDPGIGRA